jgi:hypothetical protein
MDRSQPCFSSSTHRSRQSPAGFGICRRLAGADRETSGCDTAVDVGCAGGRSVNVLCHDLSTPPGRANIFLVAWRASIYGEARLGAGASSGAFARAPVVGPNACLSFICSCQGGISGVSAVEAIRFACGRSLPQQRNKRLVQRTMSCPVECSTPSTDSRLHSPWKCTSVLPSVYFDALETCDKAVEEWG